MNRLLLLLGVVIALMAATSRGNPLPDVTSIRLDPAAFCTSPEASVFASVDDCLKLFGVSVDDDIIENDETQDDDVSRSQEVEEKQVVSKSNQKVEDN